MHIRVMPAQIPLVWEHIKYGVSQIGQVANESLSRYCIKLLCDLLSEKAQCWVQLNDERLLLNITVTKIVQDRDTNERELNVEGLYAYQGTTPTGMAIHRNHYQEFAKLAGCSRITVTSRVPRAWEILEQNGFKLQCRTYAFPVEG